MLYSFEVQQMFTTFYCNYLVRYREMTFRIIEFKHIFTVNSTRLLIRVRQNELAFNKIDCKYAVSLAIATLMELI